MSMKSIKERREALNLKQEDIARAIGKTHQAVGAVEKAVSNQTVRNLIENELLKREEKAELEFVAGASKAYNLGLVIGNEITLHGYTIIKNNGVYVAILEADSQMCLSYIENVQKALEFLNQF